mmetsp:Transcript_134279/g.335046  ORF Transcript_134279/g.335046 Transcript_134279/m.335046 type:complete len:238 (-) Transcript_134279:1027-1740(-)
MHSSRCSGPLNTGEMKTFTNKSDPSPPATPALTPPPSVAGKLKRKWSFSTLQRSALIPTEANWLSSTGNSVSKMWGSHCGKFRYGSCLTKSTISAAAPTEQNPLPAAPPSTTSSRARKEAFSICRQTSFKRCTVDSKLPSLLTLERISKKTSSVSAISWSSSAENWSSSRRAFGTRGGGGGTETASGPSTSLRPTLPPPVITKTSGCLRRNSAGFDVMKAVTGFLKRCRKRPQSEEM